MTHAHACFELRRSIAAAPARVWHLLTDPAARSAWGPPSADEVLVFDRTDLREGGVELHRCGPVAAPDMRVETRWLRLAPPETASFTETLRHEGRILSVSLITCTLDPDGRGTLLSAHIAVSSFVGGNLARAHRTGWNHALDNLAALHTEILA